MTTTVEPVEFRRSDVEPLLGYVRELRDAGGGWLNLQPVPVDADEPEAAPQPGAGLLGWFGSVPVAPVCTWVPARPGRRRVEPATVGIQHGQRRRVLPLLREQGLELPADARLRGDHPRRGLVAELATTTSDRDVVTWLVEAGVALSTVPLRDEWVALVYRSV
ncbi:MAG: hypothetical protein MUF83_20435 [Acidimicrobiales bacterium]|jgi:hypothetical protein|nr:hypothetical protein [Acidimicrobiales bacterium]